MSNYTCPTCGENVIDDGSPEYDNHSCPIPSNFITYKVYLTFSGFNNEHVTMTITKNQGTIFECTWYLGNKKGATRLTTFGDRMLRRGAKPEFYWYNGLHDVTYTLLIATP